MLSTGQLEGFVGGDVGDQLCAPARSCWARAREEVLDHPFGERLALHGGAILEADGRPGPDPPGRRRRRGDGVDHACWGRRSRRRSRRRVRDRAAAPAPPPPRPAAAHCRAGCSQESTVIRPAPASRRRTSAATSQPTARARPLRFGEVVNDVRMGEIQALPGPNLYPGSVIAQRDDRGSTGRRGRSERRPARARAVITGEGLRRCAGPVRAGAELEGVEAVLWVQRRGPASGRRRESPDDPFVAARGP